MTYELKHNNTSQVYYTSDNLIEFTSGLLKLIKRLDFFSTYDLFNEFPITWNEGYRESLIRDFIFAVAAKIWESGLYDIIEPYHYNEIFYFVFRVILGGAGW